MTAALASPRGSLTSQAALGTPGMPQAPPAGGSLATACRQPPGIACRIVWDLTHSRSAASITDTYLAHPVLRALQIAFVIALALIARSLVHRMISKITDRAGANLGKLDAINRLVGERRYQRAQALGSLLRNASSVVIFGIAGVTIAGYVGLNLAPILASAGVLGLAIGFGSQSLVRDFLSGIFMLLEDQYGVGDVIDAGEATGTVEAVGLRTTRLRDVNGVVWHIRNGTINRIGNQSQGWSRAVVDFPVPYPHDLGRVRAVMKEAAVRLWEEPHWRQLILEEPEVWGVESVYSDAVVIRLVARTQPMHQQEVARALRERLKTALDVPGDDAGTAIAAAGGPPGAAPPAAAVPSPAAAPVPPMVPIAPRATQDAAAALADSPLPRGTGPAGTGPAGT